MRPVYGRFNSRCAINGLSYINDLRAANDMAHLLHIDSSIQGEASVSRRLSARAAAAWRSAHPDGTVTYRDLGAHPLPHHDAASGLAERTPPEQRTPEQAAAWARTLEIVGEVK